MAKYGPRSARRAPALLALVLAAGHKAQAAESVAAAVDKGAAPSAATCSSASDPTCRAPVTDNALLQREGVLRRALQSEALEAAPVLRPAPNNTGGDIVMEWDPKTIRPLPICHPTHVSAACRKLGGDEHGNVTQEEIRDDLAANETVIAAFWKALGLGEGSARCEDLCEALTHYVIEVGGILPATSDMACFTLRGQTKCDVPVEPYRLRDHVSPGGYDGYEPQPPDHGAKVEPEEDDKLEQPPGPSGDEGDGSSQRRWWWPVGGGEQGSGLFQRSLVLTSSGDLRVRRRRHEPLGEAHEAKGAPPGPPAGAGGPSRRRTDEGACPYTLWEVCERLANMFRFYPATGNNLTINFPGNSTGRGHGNNSERDITRVDGQEPPSLGQASSMVPPEVEAVIAGSTVEAKAWLSTVLAEMGRNGTESFRDTWFGGAGELTKAEVRQRVLMTMNFVERELIDGVRYVYPANDAADSSCAGSTIAYVWKWVSNEEGYVETAGPVCDDTKDPFTNHCGIDDAGRYYVYLCQLWFEGIGTNARISTLVHEAAHHAGPSDVTYDKEYMKAHLSQADQLNNAANFQYFSEDVAQTTWGCPDASVVTGLPFTCNPSPCTCRAFQDMCEDQTFGPQIRQQCPATCGLCVAPSTTTTAAPNSDTTAAPTTTPTPTTTTANVAATTTTNATGAGTKVGGCCQPEGTVRITIGQGTYEGSCTAFAYNSFCHEPAVVAQCPVSCSICVPEGCEDDPKFTIMTSAGLLTCKDWEQYTCWESVKEHCPTACDVGVCGQ